MSDSSAADCSFNRFSRFCFSVLTYSCACLARSNSTWNALKKKSQLRDTATRLLNNVINATSRCPQRLRNACYEKSNFEHYLQILQIQFSFLQTFHIVHHALQMAVRVSTLSVRIVAAGQGGHQKRDQDHVFGVVYIVTYAETKVRLVYLIP